MKQLTQYDMFIESNEHILGKRRSSKILVKFAIRWTRIKWIYIKSKEFEQSDRPIWTKTCSCGFCQIQYIKTGGDTDLMCTDCIFERYIHSLDEEALCSIFIDRLSLKEMEKMLLDLEDKVDRGILKL